MNYAIQFGNSWIGFHIPSSDYTRLLPHKKTEPTHRLRTAEHRLPR
jgi:hypothetical protein